MKTMALSGKATTLFTNNNAFELIIEWSASQNIAGNSSSVTAIMKLRGVQSWSSVSDATASATSITINGNTKNFTANSTIRGGQTKELGRHTVTVPHNADGTKTFNISGAHYFDIYWSGGSPITPSLSNNYTLNTIPRASTGSGTAFAFTANSTISISRASTAFTHKARFRVDGLFIKELTGLTTSGTFRFTDAERKSIVTKMANRTTVQCRVDLWTYNGSTQIGGMYQFTYNVTAPAKASGTVADFTISTAGFPVELTNFNTGAKFTYRATWMYCGMGDLVNNPTTANFTFPLTQANVNTMLAETPNSNGTRGTLRVQSFFDGVQFGGNTDIKPINAKINATVYAPDVKAGSTFKDTNATSVAVTGNNQIVVKTLSNVTVDIPAGLGTAKGGATLTKIRLTLGGTTKDVDYVATATTLTLGTTNASSNSNLNVSVIDSRGNIGTWTTPVTVVDYTSPILSPVIERVNNYETSTAVILAGKYTRTTVGGVDKNAIGTVRYRYKQTSSTVWSALANLPYTATGGNISSPPNTFINLDNTYSWDLEITATDKFNISSTSTVIVPEGIPLVFFDTKLKSIGVNRFPDKERIFQIDGALETMQDQFYSRGGYVTDFRNSDIIGVNGFFFNDSSDGQDEGINFPKTGVTTMDKPFTALTDYDTLRAKDGVLYLNNRPIFSTNYTDGVIWSGALCMNETQTLTLPKSIRTAPNGWILVMQAYDNGTLDRDFSYSIVHKTQPDAGFHNVAYSDFGDINIGKYLYLGGGGTTLKGSRNASFQKGRVLVKVIEF